MRLGQAPTGTLVIYTDGGGGDAHENAGFGVCVTTKQDDWSPTGQPEVMDELHGPVCCDPASAYYAKASVHTNNTAELTGLLQANLWLERDGGTEEAILCTDSTYAMGCTDGSFNGSDNLELYLTVRERFEREQDRRGGHLSLLHVKAHSGDIGNDDADCFAWWGKGDGPHSQLPMTVGEDNEENDLAHDRLDAQVQRLRDELAMDPS